MKSRHTQITTLTIILGTVGVMIVVLPLLVLLTQALSSGIRSDCVGNHSSLPALNYLHILAWSTLTALVSATAATTLGVFVAIGARSSPRIWARIIDTGCIFPLVIPPFVQASAWRVAFGRAGIVDSITGITFSFTGFFSLVWVFTTSLFPLAYFGTRLALSRVSPALIDATRVMGGTTTRVLSTIILPPSLRAVPLEFGLIFVLVLSDPLVPTFVGTSIPSAAEHVWIHATAAGNISVAATLSVLMLLPTTLLLVGLLTLYRQAWHDPQFALFEHSYSRSRRHSLSVPAGIRIWPRTLPGLSLTLITLTMLATMLITGASETEGHINAVVIFNTIALALTALIGAGLLVIISLWLRTLLTRVQYLIDFLYFVILCLPGSTIGTGLALTYGARATDHGLFLPLSALDTSIPGSVLITVSYLTTATPLTYFAVRLFGPVITSRMVETARVLGASPWRIIVSVVLPHIRHSFAVATTIVTATSAIMVSPLMWVTSPDTPVIVPRLFTLLDHVDYASAFTLAIVTAAVILILLAGTLSTLRINPSGGRR
ncbi:MAG: ABC transporter permease subunit [Actinomycetaceae bacterium]|nr:ABC transporter permease subunit [Actinomycetaceae bacterium]